MIIMSMSRYASEVDIDFVRKAVRSIGRITIKVEAAADACIHSLLGLIETKVSYVVQEAIIVIKDIFRRYPGKYEGIIPKLCENLDVLDEPEAKASMVWIIGQFANRIDNADELMDDLTYNFLEEPTEVQFALVTAAVKLFIYKSSSDSVKALVHKVLKWTTEETDNPDLRDRGFMYWRLLAINPAVAGEIVLSEKPAITTDADRMDRGALDQLLLHTGTLGSIYHKNPEVRRQGHRPCPWIVDCIDLPFPFPDVHSQRLRQGARRYTRVEPAVETAPCSHPARGPNARPHRGVRARANRT
jgi:AP-2 complex subunit beta-1